MITTSGGVPPTNAVCNFGYMVPHGISSMVTEISGCSWTKLARIEVIVEPSEPVSPFQKEMWVPPEPRFATTFVAVGAGVGVLVACAARVLEVEIVAIDSAKVMASIITSERLNIL